MTEPVIVEEFLTSPLETPSQGLARLREMMSRRGRGARPPYRPRSRVRPTLVRDYSVVVE